MTDKFALLRSMAHTGGGHPAGSLQLLSGDPDAQDKIVPVYPDLMSVAHYLRRGETEGSAELRGRQPDHALRQLHDRRAGLSGAFLRAVCRDGRPSAPTFKVPNVGLADADAASAARKGVCGCDNRSISFRRAVDDSGVMRAMDRYESQAMNLLTSPAAAQAFDLHQ